MAVTTWSTTFIDGKEFLVIDVAKLRVPLEWDPSSNVFIAVAAPDGGILNHPALVQGEDGDTPDIDATINFTALDYDDPTAEFASFTELSPNLYQLNLGLRNGAPGEDGDTVLTPSDYGTPVAARILQVTSDLSGFELTPQKVGDRYYPAAINPVPSGNPAYTLCDVPIAAQPFDWRPHVEGQCVITGTGTDVRVDLIARLNNAAAGEIVGRAFGIAGQTPPTHVLSSGPPAGAANTSDKVLAGNSAVVYLRTERQSGANTYTTSAATSSFYVRVCPIP